MGRTSEQKAGWEEIKGRAEPEGCWWERWVQGGLPVNVQRALQRARARRRHRAASPSCDGPVPLPSDSSERAGKGLACGQAVRRAGGGCELAERKRQRSQRRSLQNDEGRARKHCCPTHAALASSLALALSKSQR